MANGEYTTKQEYIDGFMQGKYDGKCPSCGEWADAYDSDEGCSLNHFLERYWVCPFCGCEFTEKFNCTPVSIEIDNK